MTLPGADRAFVDPRKVREYLLALDHPEGRSKARAFAKVDGILRSPAGEGFGIRTIWIVHFGEDFPRLVTAYPRTQR
jgi:hypothetical protein